MINILLFYFFHIIFLWEKILFCLFYNIKVSSMEKEKWSFWSDENISFIKKLIIFTLFCLWVLFIYEVSSILIILAFSLFLNVLFAPFLNKLNSWKIGDGIGMILIYICIILFLLFTAFSIIPIFIKQLSILIDISYTYTNNIVNAYNLNGIDAFDIPEFLKWPLSQMDLSQILNSLKDNIGQISSFVSSNLKSFLTSGAGIISSITNVVMNFVFLFIFTFFIALERKQIRSFFYKMLPETYSKYLLKKEKDVVNTLYNWLKSQLILWISLFFITLFGLLFIKLFWVHIDEIFTLALIAGMMEFVPYVGPILALLPALAIAFWISFKAVIIIIILYIAIQQLENNVLVPYVMGKTLSLSPFAVLIGMMIWGSLLGIVWIIIAVPLVAIIQIFLQDYLKRK